MTAPNWTVLVPKAQIDAPKTELWARVCEFVRGPRRILIVAEGKWNYDPHSSCGPGGNPDEGFDDSNLHKSALRGSLIVKIGGSSADTPGSEKLIAAGSYCVFEIAENVAGALFVTMNDNPKRFYLHGGQLTITVSAAPTA